MWHLSICQTSDGTGQGGNISSSGPVVLFYYKPTTSIQTQTQYTNTNNDILQTKQTTISYHDREGRWLYKNHYKCRYKKQWLITIIISNYNILVEEFNASILEHSNVFSNDVTNLEGLFRLLHRAHRIQWSLLLEEFHGVDIGLQLNTTVESPVLSGLFVCPLNRCCCGTELLSTWGAFRSLVADRSSRIQRNSTGSYGG